MATKLELIERHGTLDEFAKAVWEAQAQNMCTAQEAVDAIAAYARELAEGSAVTQEVEALLDPDHECEALLMTNRRIWICDKHYETGESCRRGCCRVFICKECGVRFMANARALTLRVLRENEPAVWEDACQ